MSAIDLIRWNDKQFALGLLLRRDSDSGAGIADLLLVQRTHLCGKLLGIDRSQRFGDCIQCPQRFDRVQGCTGVRPGVTPVESLAHEVARRAVEVGAENRLPVVQHRL
jgi:hypothetical protein